MVEDRDDSRGVGAPAGASRRLEACQSPVWDTALAMVALSDAGVRGRPSGAARAPPSGCSPRRSPRRGDWSVAQARARARRLGVRVRQRQLPRRRRHRRGRARAAARVDRPARAARRAIDGAIGRALRWVEGHAELRRRLGRVRRRQHARARARAAVPGLRRGDRRAERRRDRARRRDARRARARRHARGAAAACAGCSSTRSPTARGSGAGASTTSTAPALRCPALIAAGVEPSRARASAARSPGSSATRTRTAAGARTRAPTTTRSGSAAGPSTASQTAWALLALHAAGERSPALARGVAWLRRHPARRRRLGRAAVHRHRLPLRLLHQLPPLPADVPDHGARALPGSRDSRGGGGRPRRARRATGVMLDSRRADRRPRRRRGDGARADGELPRRQPPAAAPRRARTCSPLYGFARLVDELGDSTAPAGDRLAALDWLEGELDRAFAGRADAPAARAPGADAARVRPAARAVRAPDRGQPRRPARRAATRPGSSCAATARCRPTRSASSCSACSGSPRPARIALSDSICTALQLAEHCQDVAEDLAARAVYLPAEDLERFGCAESDLAARARERAAARGARLRGRRARAGCWPRARR